MNTEYYKRLFQTGMSELDDKTTQAQGIQHIVQAAQGGHPDAMVEVAVYAYAAHGYREAMSWVRRMAEDGNLTGIRAALSDIEELEELAYELSGCKGHRSDAHDKESGSRKSAWCLPQRTQDAMKEFWHADAKW